MKIFLDSDVIISSLLSSSGAAHLLIKTASPDKYISNYSVKELALVIKRLGVKPSGLKQLLKQLNVVKIKKPFLANYVVDSHDSHVVSGAVKAKAQFLLTYNIKHFKAEKIKRNLGILVYRPAQFLQYLRSLN